MKILDNQRSFKKFKRHLRDRILLTRKMANTIESSNTKRETKSATHREFTVATVIIYRLLAENYELLEYIIQNLAEQKKWGSDLVDVKTELQNLRSTLKEPMYRRVNQFITTMEEVQEKRTKAEGKYIA